VNYEVWLIGYYDAGLTDITPGDARSKIHAFVRRAMAGGHEG
jgi:hypothetical protein